MFFKLFVFLYLRSVRKLKISKLKGPFGPSLNPILITGSGPGSEDQGKPGPWNERNERKDRKVNENSAAPIDPVDLLRRLCRLCSLRSKRQQGQIKGLEDLFVLIFSKRCSGDFVDTKLSESFMTGLTV